MKSHFILHHDTATVLNELTDEQAGQLIKAILSYSLNPEEPTGLSGLMTAVFHPFKAQLDRDLEAYKAKCEKNKSNGSKGGRPTQKKPNGLDELEENPKKPNGLNGNPKNPKEEEEEKEEEYINKKRFTKPSLQEVVEYSKAYSTEKNLVRINEQSWMDYQLANGWKLSNGNAMKDWKASVRTWYGKQPVNSVQQQQGRRYV